MTSPVLFSAPPPISDSSSTTKTHSPRAFFSLQPPSITDASASLIKTTTRRNRRNRLILVSTTKASSSDSTSTTTVDNPSVASSSGATALLFSEEDEKAESARIGARVRVKVPLKVYHIPKVAEFDLSGKEGVLKQYVGLWKGKRISANLPFKVAFVEEIEGRDGPVKFFAHLKEDEFEYLE